MPRKIEQGELALYKYNKIRYSFVDLDAGEQQVLTSDPWSFLSSSLQMRINKSRGGNRTKVERAIYYSGLAEDFYRAAEFCPLPAKGALLYYGMLDLVKCYLSLNDVPLESTHEHHGLMLPIGVEQTIEVKSKMKDAVNIFYEFTRLLGKPVEKSIQIRFEKALSHIPEVHSIYTSLGHLSKRKLLPVEIEFQVNEARDKLFTEIIYQKEQEAKVEVEKFLKGDRKTYFREGFPREKEVVYRAARRKTYNQGNINRIYKNILNEYKNLDVVRILTKNGYRYYVDLRPGPLWQDS